MFRRSRHPRRAAQRDPAFQGRKGFALMLALGAMVVLAVLVAGSSYITLQEYRLGQNQLIQSEAFAAAEYGLNKIQADWDKTPNLTMPNGTSYDTAYFTTANPTPACSVKYTRLNDETFWIVSTGYVVAGNNTSKARTAVKRLGAILRLRIPTIKADGAITSKGDIKVQGAMVVNGGNKAPNAGWGCGSYENKAGLVVPPGITPTGNGTVTGTPTWKTDPLAAQDATYISYGDETWGSLVSMANITVVSANPVNGMAPSLLNGGCNKSDQNNWGEPWRAGYDGKTAGDVVPACENYFPIIHYKCPTFVEGPPVVSGCTINFNGGRGQGILLISGDAKILGSFEFNGLIVVAGDVSSGAGGSKVNGAVMSRNADLDTQGSEFTGGGTIQFSGCALERAMLGSAQVVQAKERAFTELYGK